jgi:Vacuolar protein sorting-associated protein 62
MSGSGFWVVCALALAGCATDRVLAPPAVGLQGLAGDPVHRAPPAEITDPTDADGDGIPDQLEDYLIAQFAPEVRLAPSTIDWTRPANVDWYLPQVRMRFSHHLCRDHEVMAAGTITSDNIWRQQHPRSSWLCAHTRHLVKSGLDGGGTAEAFFLKATKRSVWRGIPEAQRDQWRVYAHVQPSTYVRPSDHLAAAYDVQVWFFYAYNAAIAGFNHEADWEHMTVSVTADFAVVSVYFSEHRGGRRVDDLRVLRWVDGTHVVGFSARGTHASYPDPGAHRGQIVDDLCYDGGPRWQTWRNFINLGERGHILGGQDWARYDGRWGQTGMWSVTTGPVGPMFNPRWPIAGIEYRVTQPVVRARAPR